MELGVATFADLSSGISPEQRMRDLMEEVQLADQLGFDVFAIGEHHREDFLISSPTIPLAAAAVTTERIRLSSAVTVLSSDDPVRVFQDFAEVDLLSGGRAEIMAGRGSFIESFPLFGYDLKDYDELYAEKLDLLLALRDSVHVTWSGRHRAPLDDAGVWPRPVQEQLPVWVAVGGSPQSIVRAGTLGCPWCSRSSAASPSASCRSSTSTARRLPRPGMSPTRRASPSTRTPSSRRPPRRPTRPSPRPTWR
jgi:alkanesulfonate monooxygenase SsuD/methylene tetrahydromethanopterin reductase-like flavin-dependent oxidoreductase (luciferase family)